MMKLIDAAVCGYVVIGLLTFGYDYNVNYEYSTDRFAQMIINPSRALFVGIVWPTYWTVEAFSTLRPVSETPIDTGRGAQ